MRFSFQTAWPIFDSREILLVKQLELLYHRNILCKISDNFKCRIMIAHDHVIALFLDIGDFSYADYHIHHDDGRELGQIEYIKNMERLIFFSDSEENKMLFELDGNGNIIHYNYLGVFECWMEYDESGTVIRIEDGYGRKSWIDKKNYSNRLQVFRDKSKEYDKDGRLILRIDNDQRYHLYTYDEKGNLTYYKCSDGCYVTRTYHKADAYTLIEEKYSGEYKWYNNYSICNDAGKQIFTHDIRGFESRTDYDKSGNPIYYEDSSGYEWKICTMPTTAPFPQYGRLDTYSKLFAKKYQTKMWLRPK